MIGILSTAESKFCRGCVRTLPISHFRLRKSGSTDRHSRCDDCHRECQREWYAQRQAAKRNGTVSKANTKLKNAASVEEVRFILGTMLAHFGGVEGYLKAWVAWTNKAMAHSRGSASAGNTFFAIHRLLELFTPKPTNMGNLSDDDLVRALDKSILLMVESSPVLVADALRRAGWTVTAPE